MKQRSHNSTVHAFLNSRIFLLGSLIVAIFFALGFARAYYQDFKVKKEISRLEAEVSALENKKIESLDILSYVQSDAYVEDRARTELHMKKPGERVLLLQDTDTTIEADWQAHEQTRQFISNPVKWWYYFTHKPLPQESDN